VKIGAIDRQVLDALNQVIYSFAQLRSREAAELLTEPDLLISLNPPGGEPQAVRLCLRRQSSGKNEKGGHTQATMRPSFQRMVL
jgi:hypothetical protein